MSLKLIKKPRDLSDTLKDITNFKTQLLNDSIPESMIKEYWEFLRAEAEIKIPKVTLKELLIQSIKKLITMGRLTDLEGEMQVLTQEHNEAQMLQMSKEIIKLRKMNSRLTSEIEGLQNKPLPDNIPNLKYTKADKDFVIKLKEEKGVPFKKGAEELKLIKQSLNIDSFLRILRKYYNTIPKKRK